MVGTAKALQEKPGGGEKWLTSLRQMELGIVIDALCTLPGVGPKVAACIALFSLDQHHAVPVDTHVWKVISFFTFSIFNIIQLFWSPYFIFWQKILPAHLVTLVVMNSPAKQEIMCIFHPHENMERSYLSIYPILK